MKLRFSIFISLLAICLLAQCDDRDFGEPRDERIPVLLSFENIAHTRVSEDTNEWDNQDYIGVFMINSGEVFDIANIKQGHMRNQCFLYQNHRGGFIQMPMGDTTYYDPHTNIDFIAYYPYQENPLKQNNYQYFEVDLSDQQNKKLDVLYSDNAKDIGRSHFKSRINLSFRHTLSKLELQVSSGQGITPGELSISKIELSGIFLKGDFMLKNGRVENLKSPGTTELVERSSPGLYRAFVIPQKGAPYQLHITLQNGAMFTYHFPSDMEFQEGNIHTYDIEVNKTGIELTNNTITPWDGKDKLPVEDEVD